MTFRGLLRAALAGAVLLASAVPASAEAVKVNALNFARAETDMYFARTVKQAGGLGKFTHLRVPTPITEQRVVRMNRDTLYSSAVFDLDAGPVTITLPNTGKRFSSSPSRPSSARRARLRSIRASTSLTAACRARSRCCRTSNSRKGERR